MKTLQALWADNMGLEDLPTELVHRIFALLPFPDLKSVALVCSRLAALATAPRLWEHFNCDGFAISKQGLKHYLKVLQLPRSNRCCYILRL